MCGWKRLTLGDMWLGYDGWQCRLYLLLVLMAKLPSTPLSGMHDTRRVLGIMKRVTTGTLVGKLRAASKSLAKYWRGFEVDPFLAL